MSVSSAVRGLRILAPAMAVILLLGLATEILARGRGGGGGSGRGGYVSRGGPARGGSIRNERSGGGYRSHDRGGRESLGGRERAGGNQGDGSIEREGSFENRRGETIDYSGSATRTEDGIHREGSWTSSSGASGGGSADVGVSDGRVQSVDRSRHAESADGETLNREIQSERHGDHVDREGKIETSTGVDAESKGTIRKTDDGFIARGGVVGKEGAAGGTIARKGDETRIRGVATDGKHVSWGRVHCSGSKCHGGRVTVNAKDYYRYPYYYYPYYYGWYSCPYGSAQTWSSRYGTPVYGCANVVVVHTTISLGSSDASYLTAGGTGSAAAAGSSSWPREAAVSSEPVLMYELSAEVVVYATTDEPVGVYSVKHGDRYYWAPGPDVESTKAKAWVEMAAGMAEPTANATVIRYAVGERTVYLTNERPAAGVHAETADQLFAWMPGVKEPTDEETALIRQVVEAHQSGGKKALDREVRKLEKDHQPPP